MKACALLPWKMNIQKIPGLKWDGSRRQCEQHFFFLQQIPMSRSAPPSLSIRNLICSERWQDAETVKRLCKSPGDGSGTRQLSRSVHLYILKGALSHNQRGGLSYTWASVYNNLFIVGLVGWKSTEVCHSNGTPRTRAVEASTDRMGSTQGSGVNLTQSLLSYTVCPLAVVYAITQKIK